MTEATCDHCGSNFEPRRKDQRFCSTRCRQRSKDAGRKDKRLAKDRERYGVDPRNYRKTDPESVAAKYGFKAVEEVCDPWDF